jgi:hypothetical protein
MSDNHSELFLIAYEEGYFTANDPFVLGHPAPTEAVSTGEINRYLIAGAVYDEFTDKGLWRVRPNAMQRLVKRLLKNHDVYGFQGAGDLRRLPAAWTEKVAYAKEHRTERVVGGRTLVQARDLYLVKLDDSVIEEFGAPSLGDAWFQCLFIALAGTQVVSDAFLEVAAATPQSRKMWTGHNWSFTVRPTSTYALDYYPTVLFAKRSVG